jgi:hypothetical protein
MHYIDNLKFSDWNTSVETSVSVQTTVTAVLAADDDRQWFHIKNVSDTAVMLSFGNSSMTLQQGLRLEKNGTSYNDSFQMKDGSMFVGAIYAKAPATGKKLLVNYYSRHGLHFVLSSPSPSISPSLSPSLSASLSPSISPSYSPSKSPSYSPSLSPSLSQSLSPSISPSYSASLSPSLSPSISPSPSGG